MRGRHLAVFCWHNVEPTWCFPSSGDSGRRGLARQLTALQRLATVVPLGDALARLAAGDPLPPRAVAVTFDDGYRDNVDVAVPLLRRLGLPATFFLVPGFLNGTAEPWWESLAAAFSRTSRERLDYQGRRFALATAFERQSAATAISEQLKLVDTASREGQVRDLCAYLDPEGYAGARQRARNLFMDWAGARDLVRAGFEVASHTRCHAILSRETAESQRTDLASAREELQEQLQQPVDLLAYPNGRTCDVNAATEDAARAAGHRFALTTIAGLNDTRTEPLRIHRYVMYPEQDLAAYGKIGTWALRQSAAARRLVSGRSRSAGPAAASTECASGLGSPS